MSASARDAFIKWFFNGVAVASPEGRAVAEQQWQNLQGALSAAGFVIVRAHKWFIPPGIEYECCRDCGIVRRGDDRHRPCIGPVRVGLRHHESLKDEYTEEEESAEGKK